jgi:proline-specific peptidase
MSTFAAYDGTRLAYHEVGDGPPLLCVPGGPARASAYLGDLGGLSAHRRLILLDHRGTGESDVPTDPTTYRCDRLVDDVEALRSHLGLEPVDLLGHSAAGSILLQYAARHPDRLRRLVLVAPSATAAGLEQSDDEWTAAIHRRSEESWYPEAYAAMERLMAGDVTAETRLAAAPFAYGRWTDVTSAHAASGATQRSPTAAAGFAEEGWLGDVERTRAGLARLGAPVLVVGGELDLGPTARQQQEIAALFRDGRAITLPASGHFPWLDDPAGFVAAVLAFLG